MVKKGLCEIENVVAYLSVLGCTLEVRSHDDCSIFIYWLALIL